jgi:hypothetical protein
MKTILKLRKKEIKQNKMYSLPRGTESAQIPAAAGTL